MKILICTLLFYCCISSCVFAQNLVTNPSFENYITCPPAPATIPSPSDAITSLEGWYRATGGTSDYLHSCIPVSSYVSVPDNLAGHQLGCRLR